MENPIIRISLEKVGDEFILIYQDNGIGITANRIENSDSFGMELIETILEQIDGRLKHEENEEWSTYLKIIFKRL